MQREERVITHACVNIIVPLAILGLFANFIPYLLIIVPLEEQDVCWFYYLTRSPYQLNYIENWLYKTADYMRYIITALEMLVLLYYVLKIQSMKMNQINIAKESILITLQWFILTIFNLFAKLVKGKNPENQKSIQLLICGVLQLRNLLTALISYYFSIYQVNKELTN